MLKKIKRRKASTDNGHFAILLKKTGRKKQAAEMQALARNILSRNPADRAAGLTVDVRELEPKSFLPR